MGNIPVVWRHQEVGHGSASETRVLGRCWCAALASRDGTGGALPTPALLRPARQGPGQVRDAAGAHGRRRERRQSGNRVRFLARDVLPGAAQLRGAWHGRLARRQTWSAAPAQVDGGRRSVDPPACPPTTGAEWPDHRRSAGTRTWCSGQTPDGRAIAGWWRKKKRTRGPKPNSKYSAPLIAPNRRGAAHFLNLGGPAQERYEDLRSHVFTERLGHRLTPAQFDLARVARFGVLGLLDNDPLGVTWATHAVDQFDVELIPVGPADASERMARLCAVLYSLTTTPRGGDAATRRTVRPCLDGDAGER